MQSLGYDKDKKLPYFVADTPSALAAATRVWAVTRASVTQAFAVPLPAPIRDLEKMPLSWFVTPEARGYGHEVFIPLKRELIILANDIWSEMNSRVSFDMSSSVSFPARPKSTSPIRSGLSTSTFAGCGSPWKKPCRKIIVIHASVTR